MRCKVGVVLARLLGAQCGKIFFDRWIVPADLVAVTLKPADILSPRCHMLPRQRRHRDSILPQHICRDSLINFGFNGTLAQRKKVRMTVSVDKARTDNLSASVNFAIKRAGKLRSDSHDAVVFKGDLARKARRARSVDNSGIADYGFHAHASLFL